MNRIRTWWKIGSPLRLRQWRGQGVLTLSALAAIALMTGCRQDMHDQPKFVPQRGTPSLPMAARSGRRSSTPSRADNCSEDSFFYTGLIERQGSGHDALSRRRCRCLSAGQERFNIYCTPCHSRVGNGAGMIVQRGYKPAGNFTMRGSGRAVGSLLLRDDQWLRGHAGLFGPAHAG